MGEWCQGICFPGSPAPAASTVKATAFPQQSPPLTPFPVGPGAMPLFSFSSRSQGVPLFLALGRSSCALWFPNATHIFVHVPFMNISICSIFVCHVLPAGLQVPQVWHLPPASTPHWALHVHCYPDMLTPLLFCTHPTLSPFSCPAWNILRPDLCTPGSHSGRHQPRRKAFSDVLT